MQDGDIEEGFKIPKFRNYTPIAKDLEGVSVENAPIGPLSGENEKETAEGIASFFLINK